MERRYVAFVKAHDLETGQAVENSRQKLFQRPVFVQDYPLQSRQALKRIGIDVFHDVFTEVHQLQIWEVQECMLRRDGKHRRTRDAGPIMARTSEGVPSEAEPRACWRIVEIGCPHLFHAADLISAQKYVDYRGGNLRGYFHDSDVIASPHRQGAQTDLRATIRKALSRVTAS